MKKTIIPAVVILGAFVSLAPVVASAQSARGARMASSSEMRQMRMASSSAAREVRTGDRVDKVTTRGNTEITKRIASLNQLATRIDAMKNVSATQKANVAAQVQTEIASLTALQAKIDAEASSTTSMGTTSPLREDVTAITASYRIYALIIPQADILSAADRVATLVTSFTTVGTKLQTRITAAQTAGKDVTAMTASLADLNAKITDATAQGQKAITAVSGLTPDNGNTTVAASNKTALEAGRAAIKAAQADFQAADKDAKSILQALKGMNIGVTASTSVSVQ